jgi:hypothetical protein
MQTAYTLADVSEIEAHKQTHLALVRAAIQVEAGRRLRESWIPTIEGAVIEVDIELGHPAMVRMLQRVFYSAAHALHFISNQSRAKISGEAVTLIENRLFERLNIACGEIAIRKEQASVMIGRAREAGELLEARYNANRLDKERIPVSSPVARKLLELYRAADRFLLDIETLYLNGLIAGQERNDEIYKVKRMIVDLAIFIGRAHDDLKKRLRL